jgi:hypothetical protein
MRIVYHLGAHCTDDERLLRCLLANRSQLARQGIAVPQPARYRTLLRDTVIALKGAAASVETQDQVLDEIMEDEVSPKRLILGWDSFLSLPQWVLKGTLYPAAGERIRAFTQVFPDNTAEFHLALRNPATFLPELFAKQRGKSYADFMEGVNPTRLRWSDTIRDILQQNPGVPLTIWCDEDTPLIWPEVLQAVSGHAPGMALAETTELLGTLMTSDGLTRMQGYLDSHPPSSVLQRRRIVSAFLDKFALPEMIEVELDLPGWTADTVAEMTAAYEADVASIAATPGITFLAP